MLVKPPNLKTWLCNSAAVTQKKKNLLLSTHLIPFLIQDKTTRPTSSFKYWTYFIKDLMCKWREGEGVYFFSSRTTSLLPYTCHQGWHSGVLQYSVCFVKCVGRRATLKHSSAIACATCSASHLNCVARILKLSSCDPATSLEWSGHCGWVCMWWFLHLCIWVWEGRCNVSCRPCCAWADKWHRGPNAAWILSRNVCV